MSKQLFRVAAKRLGREFTLLLRESMGASVVQLAMFSLAGITVLTGVNLKTSVFLVMYSVTAPLACFSSL